MQNYLLKAKLQLVERNLPQTQEFFGKARNIAMEKGYERYVSVITTELRKHENDLPKWQIDENASLIDRFDQLNIKDLFVAIRQGRVDVFSPSKSMPQPPDLAEMEAFTEQLRKRNISW